MTNIPMNNPNINSGLKTMSSREIAELVESRHDSVRRTVERLAEKEVISSPPLVNIYFDTYKREQREYLLTERDSYIVVAQLSPEFTARLVDRWQELEISQIPQNLPDALRLAADLSEQKQIAEAKLLEVQPKVLAFDNFINAEGLYGLQNAARVIGAKPNKFVGWLKQKFLFYQGGALVFYAQYRELGIFELKTTMVDDTARHRVYVTPKGIDYLRKRMPDEFLIGGAA